MFNGAQIHLALNHLPVVGTLIGLLILTLGYLIRHPIVKRTALAVILFASVTALPAYFSGEEAEEVVEHKAGVLEKDIHEHEEAAELALVLSMIGGVFAGGALWLAWKKGHWESKATLATGMISVATTAVLMNAAHLGGLIRHDELKPMVQTSTISNSADPKENHHSEDHED